MQLSHPCHNCMMPASLTLLHIHFTLQKVFPSLPFPQTRLPWVSCHLFLYLPLQLLFVHRSSLLSNFTSHGTSITTPHNNLNSTIHNLSDLIPHNTSNSTPHNTNNTFSNTDSLGTSNTEPHNTLSSPSLHNHSPASISAPHSTTSSAPNNLSNRDSTSKLREKLKEISAAVLSSVDKRDYRYSCMED